jgi:hypothetical protein
MDAHKKSAGLSFNLKANHHRLGSRFFCHTSPTEGPCYRTPAVPSRSAGVSFWPPQLLASSFPTVRAPERETNAQSTALPRARRVRPHPTSVMHVASNSHDFSTLTRFQNSRALLLIFVMRDIQPSAHLCPRRPPWYTPPHMAAKNRTKKPKATLDSVLSTVERGFVAVADDITDIKARWRPKTTSQMFERWRPRHQPPRHQTHQVRSARNRRTPSTRSPRLRHRKAPPRREDCRLIDVTTQLFRCLR